MKDLLRPGELRELAGDRSYARGESYFSGGLVRSLTQYGQRLSAVVIGTRRYKASIWVADGVSREGDALRGDDGVRKDEDWDNDDDLCEVDEWDEDGDEDDDLYEDDEEDEEREDGGLRYICSCPAGGFCKHLVAVALAFKAGKADVLDDGGGDDDESDAPTGVRMLTDAGKLVGEGKAAGKTAGKAAGKGGKSAAASKAKSKTRTPDLQTHLMAQPKERLVTWVLERAALDGAFLERLRLDAAAANPAGVDMADFRRRIDKAFDFPDGYAPDGDDDYDGYGGGYDEDRTVPMERIEPVLKALEKVLAQGHATAIASLAEYAVVEFEKVATRLGYDPDGAASIGKLFCVLHVQALRAQTAKPDPQMLADWVFNRALAAAPSYGDFPWEEYRSLLGEAGMKRLRSRVESAWAKVPAKTKDQRRYDDDSGERHFLKDAMIAFAQADGDVDARATIEQKDLSSEHNYLTLAQIFRDAKRHDEALEWAEKGWQTFAGDYHHAGLREFLATEYRRRRRVDDAMSLYWDEYNRKPDLHTYAELKKQADRGRDWSAWREKAMARFRESIEVERRKAEREAEKQRAVRSRYGGGASWHGEWASRIPSAADHSRLVEILLWERNPDDAWAEAVAGGCSETLWLKLAETREKEHPADCVPIWHRHMINLTQHADQSNYAPAAKALQKLGHLLHRLGRDKEFAHLMADIRQTRKARRNFITELNKLHLP